MKMVFRWFAGGYDKITLEQIRQIPGMSGVVTSLLDIPVLLVISGLTTVV